MASLESNSHDSQYYLKESIFKLTALLKFAIKTGFDAFACFYN